MSAALPGNVFELLSFYLPFMPPDTPSTLKLLLCKSAHFQVTEANGCAFFWCYIALPPFIHSFNEILSISHCKVLDK